MEAESVEPDMETITILESIPMIVITTNNSRRVKDLLDMFFSQLYQKIAREAMTHAEQKYMKQLKSFKVVFELFLEENANSFTFPYFLADATASRKNAFPMIL